MNLMERKVTSLRPLLFCQRRDGCRGVVSQGNNCLWAMMPMGILGGVASRRPQTTQASVVWEAGKRKSHLWAMNDVWEAATEVGSNFWVRKSNCSC